MNSKWTHEYYHQVQGAIAAVGVHWCDFVIWTPRRVKLERIYIDYGWTMRYVPRHEHFYYRYLVRKEDTKSTGWDSATANASTDEDALEPFEHPTRDLTSILHLIGPAGPFLSHLVVHAPSDCWDIVELLCVVEMILVKSEVG